MTASNEERHPPSIGHLRAALLRLTTLVCALALPASPASATPSSDFQDSVHTLTNAVRAGDDLQPLKRRRCVQRFAKMQARQMAKQQLMFHQDLAPILDECHLGLVGENVAFGFTSAQSVLDAWMASPGHRANILRPEYRQLGVGAKQSEEGVWYIAQVFGRKLT